MSKKSSIKSLTVVNEPVFVSKDGSVQEYIPKEIVGYREAYAASLHLVFKHVADFHMAMLEIIAEKYGHDVDEMVSVIQSDSRFTDIMVNPVIAGLNIIKQEDVKDAAEAVAVVAANPVQAQPPVEASVTTTKKKIVIKRKATEATS